MHDGTEMVSDLRRTGHTFAAISDMTGLSIGQVANRARKTKRPTGQAVVRTSIPARVQDVIVRRSWEVGYSPHAILSARGDREIAHARHEIMRAVRDEIVMANGRPPSTTQIGRWFGRDHTTVSHGIRRARERYNPPS